MQEENSMSGGEVLILLFFVGIAVVGLYFFASTVKSSSENPTTTYTSGSKAYETLTKMGYTQVQEEGMTPFVCPEDEYSTRFTAKNGAGRQVSGVVCCPLVFGRCSVRE